MPAWPADSVERRPVAALAPNARNARTYSEAQIAQIAASIREWGWTVPVLIDEAGLIIAGHGRVLAAQRIGLVSVPVMIARGWSEAQKRAYLIADSKLTENGGWDDALLRVELNELAALGFDTLLSGFDAREIKAMGNPGKTDPDELPAEPDPDAAISKPGDVWICGDHRIVCGDATDPATVALALDGAVPPLMVTDPPYGVDYDAGWRNRVHRKDGSLVGGLAVGKVENDHRSRRRRLCVECRALLGIGLRQPARGEVRAPRPDHLVEVELRDWARRLSLAARVLLVRGAQGQARALEWRPHAIDGVGDRQAAALRDRALHAQAVRVHEAAD
jgi:ParB-like nuclease domain